MTLKETSWTEQVYRILDFNLQIKTTDPEIAERIQFFLQYFKPSNSNAEKNNANWVGSLSQNQESLSEAFQSTWDQKTQARPLISYESLSVSRIKNFSFYEDRHSRFILNRDTASFEGYIHPHSLKKPLFFENVLFAFILWELFSLKRYYLVHGACLVTPHEPRQTFLFPANTRSGKTTLSFGLMSCGFHLISDDLLLINELANIFPYPQHFHISSELMDAYPDLQFLKNKKPYSHFNPKRELGLEEGMKIFSKPDHPLQQVPFVSHVDWLIFPEIKPIADSGLEPMAPIDALSQFIPASPLVMFEDEYAPNHLEQLKKIVTQAQCFRLKLGRDLWLKPSLILPLLTKTLNIPNTSLQLGRNQHHATNGH